MKNLLWFIPFLTVAAWAGYGGPAVIIDGTTQVPAQVTTNHELRVIQTSPLPVTIASPVPITFPSPLPTLPVSVQNFPSPAPSVGVTNFPAVQPISAASLPLPIGAATNAELISIYTAIGLPFQAGGSIGNSSFGISGTLPAFGATPTFNLGTLNGAATNAELVAINSTLGTPMQQTGGSVTVNAGTNLNTSALALESGGHLASVDTKTPALGQALAAASVPVVMTAAQVTALTPPTSTGRTWTLLNTTDSVNVGNWPSTYPVTGTFWQSTQPVSIATMPTTPVTGTFWQTTQPVSGTVTANIGTSGSLALNSSVIGLQVTQGSTTSGQSGSLGMGAVTTGSPTYTTAQTSPFSLTTAGALRIDGSAVTQPVSGTVTATVTGVSTATNQSTMITDLAAIQTSVANIPASPSTSALQTTGNTSLATIVTNTGAAATAANQTNGNAITQVSSLPAIPTPVNANTALSARQSVDGTESNLLAPSNAIGVLVECESGNSDNLRWGFSNGTTAILSTTLGMLCEPGRDTGFMPIGAGNYLHLIAVTTASSDYVDVQWVKSQ